MKAVRESLNNRQAVVFLHGFSDHQGGVWNLFPDLIGKMCPGWNVYSLSYDTSFLPDIFGFWETDPDIPLLSQWFNGVLSYGVIPKHDRLAIVAHSMGGLVVQRAILDFPAIRAKLGHLFLFGTPSAGLRVATFLQFWNRQIGNMAEGGNFIQSLRADWNRIIGDFPSFCLHVVAGMKDGFVPPFTSLDPFPRHFHRLVKGNHREMVKARNEDHPAVQLVANVLPLNCVYGPETKDTLLPVLSQWSPESLLAKVNTLGPTPVHGQVSALAVSLDGAGMRPEAIELLKRHLDLHPDVRGTLGGRLKRKWIEERDHDAAADAVRLYYEAYVRSTQEMRDGLQPSEIEEQGYYHAINLAFFSLVYCKDPVAAKDWAERALVHCERSAADVFWRFATIGEANLYLGNYEAALENYSKARDLVADGQYWQLESTWFQAGILSQVLGDQVLSAELEKCFPLANWDTR